MAGPSPAVLTTHRPDSSVLASPIWFRYHQDAFEVVVAEDDVKLRHLTARPSCGLVVFEAVLPFRALRVEGEPVLVRGDVTDVRAAIPGRYLGADAGRRFAEQRRALGVLVPCRRPDCMHRTSR